MSKFRTPYDGTHKAEKYAINKTGVSLTQQNFKDQCDVNRIMAKYQKTGIYDHVTRYQGRYEDITSLGDYNENMNAIIEAQEAFNTLPSSLRKQFGNDPGNFLEFVANPANGEKLVEMGLATARPQETKPDIKPDKTKDKAE